MNPGAQNDHPSIHYYDSDYPSPFDTLFPENFDSITEYQGLACDIQRYLELIAESGGPVLELCCGTGRVSIPIARQGFEVTSVDFSEGMLSKFRDSLKSEASHVSNKITLIHQDIIQLSIPEKRFRSAILAFNSLLCIPDFSDQLDALRAISSHLQSNGKLYIDIVNPLRLNLAGDPVPKPFFTRKDRNTGNTYTRFAMMGPFETDHRQQLYGWYDEMTPEGFVKRRSYSLYWRPIFRFEMELMLRETGFSLVRIEGGHKKEQYTAESPRMFLTAIKI